MRVVYHLLLCVVRLDVESLAASKEPHSTVFGCGGPSTGCRHSVCLTAPRWRCQEWRDVGESDGGGGDTARRRTENNRRWTVVNVRRTDYKPGQWEPVLRFYTELLNSTYTTATPTHGPRNRAGFSLKAPHRLVSVDKALSRVTDHSYRRSTNTDEIATFTAPQYNKVTGSTRAGEACTSDRQPVNRNPDSHSCLCECSLTCVQ